MVTPAVGEVVLVRFPFSDLSQLKLRPAVCLADAGRGDWVLCQITSNAYGDSRAIPLDDPDFVLGGLKISSYARPAKRFTVGGLCVRVGKRWHRELALVAAGAFGMGCLAGAVIGLGEAVRSFHWGFATLGVGFLLSAAGLSVGGLGVVRSSVAPNHHWVA